MRLLLDTPIFLWSLAGDADLRAETRDLLRNPVNQIFLSPVSIWEALVKNQPRYPGGRGWPALAGHHPW